MPTPSRSVVGYAFGSVHRWWMAKPIHASVLAFLWYLVVMAATDSLRLLHRPIQIFAVRCAPVARETPTPGTLISADGFAVANWGILYLFAMPLGAFLMGYFLRLPGGNSAEEITLSRGWGLRIGRRHNSQVRRHLCGCLPWSTFPTCI
jgi:hypothetical protein